MLDHWELSPSRLSCLDQSAYVTEKKRNIAIARIAADSMAMALNDNLVVSHLEALKLSLGNWKTWLFVVGYMVKTYFINEPWSLI